MIHVRHVDKTFLVPERPPGLLASARALFVRKTREVRAVVDVSFTIEPGERVGFLGPNGAGKTTTLKMLSGLLHPTRGEIRIDGFDPKQRADSFLKSITLVLGQKQQLMWDLPPEDSFELQRTIYGVSDSDYRSRRAELVDLLELGTLLRRPVRQLSLGERMKCELACALLHAPKTLFLDEPTIGLDVNMQQAVRDFVLQYNTKHGATLVLTSHYMADVVALCPRVIVINDGHIVFDGSIDALRRSVKAEKQVRLVFDREVARADLESRGELIEYGKREVLLRVGESGLRETVAALLAELPVLDLTVTDPPLEEVLKELFQKKVAI